MVLVDGAPFPAGLLRGERGRELTFSLKAYLFDNDDQFAVPGWSLDVSWYISTVSAALCLSSAIGLVLSAYLLPPEDDYEFLGEPEDVGA